jgi:hypothetical protein
LPIFRLLGGVLLVWVYSKELGMRAIVVSGGVLLVAAVFGMGVVVGRFVLSRDTPSVNAPTNAIVGPAGLDNPLGDPDAVLSADASLNAPPPTTAAPLEPLVQPGMPAPINAPPAPAPLITAQAESDAAFAASAVTSACNLRVSRDAPVRSWSKKDRVTAIALGDSCATATIRIVLETVEGTALYSLQAPARDFGITASTSAEAVRERLSQLLPTDAVRAAAYPAWTVDAAPPTRSEFSRDVYEAVRSANNPVTCLKLPTATQRCVAADPTSGQVKVFSRG